MRASDMLRHYETSIRDYYSPHMEAIRQYHDMLEKHGLGMRLAALDEINRRLAIPDAFASNTKLHDYAQRAGLQLPGILDTPSARAATELSEIFERQRWESEALRRSIEEKAGYFSNNYFSGRYFDFGGSARYETSLGKLMSEEQDRLAKTTTQAWTSHETEIHTQIIATGITGATERDLEVNASDAEEPVEPIQQTIAFPPGTDMIEWARTWFSPDRVEKTFQPMIGEYQEEHCRLLSCKADPAEFQQLDKDYRKSFALAVAWETLLFVGRIVGILKGSKQQRD